MIRMNKEPFAATVAHHTETVNPDNCCPEIQGSGTG
jgi:hypothetical protein